MSLRRSVYLHDRTLSILGEIENLSGRIGEVVDRYGTLLSLHREKAVSKFSEAELRTMRDAHRSLSAANDRFATLMLDFAAGIEDWIVSGKPNDLAADDPIAVAKGLKERISKLSPVELICIIETLEANNG